MISRLLTVAFLFLLPPAARAGVWTEDFDQACANAKTADKCILLHFSEADWHGGRVPLDQDVFSKPEFKTFASTNMICVIVDFPKNKPQSRTRQDFNRQLAKRFGVKALPCVVLLSPDAVEIGRTDRTDWAPAALVAYLGELIGRHRAEQKADRSGP